MASTDERAEAIRLGVSIDELIAARAYSHEPALWEMGNAQTEG